MVKCARWDLVVTLSMCGAESAFLRVWFGVYLLVLVCVIIRGSLYLGGSSRLDARFLNMSPV